MGDSGLQHNAWALWGRDIRSLAVAEQAVCM